MTEYVRVGKSEFEEARQEFQAALATASQPYRPQGWRTRAIGLEFHGGDGHWGHIEFRTEAWERPLPIHLYAGVVSPYLLAVKNGRDPRKPPSEDLIASHAPLLAGLEIAYLHDEHVQPPPLRLIQDPYAHSGIVIGQETASSWLRDALGLLTATVRELCSDVAIRDWLMANQPANLFAIRDAILLTHRLGLKEQLAALIDRAEQADADLTARIRAKGRDRHSEDGSHRYSALWSHPRFLQFLATLDGRAAGAIEQEDVSI